MRAWWQLVVTGNHRAWSSVLQWTGSECFYPNQSTVSQNHRVLAHKLMVFVSIGTFVKSQNCSAHQSKSEELEQKSTPEQAGGSTRIYGLQILCWLSAIPSENMILPLDLITSSQNHLHCPTRMGMGFVQPANLKPLPSHVLLLQRASWKKALLPFSGHQGSNLTLACSQKVGLDYMTAPTLVIGWTRREWWFYLLESLTVCHLSVKSCAVPNSHIIFGGNFPVHFLLWSHKEGKKTEISLCSSILRV